MFQTCFGAPKRPTQGETGCGDWIMHRRFGGRLEKLELKL
jgi:hypothetical protein